MNEGRMQRLAMNNAPEGWMLAVDWARKHNLDPRAISTKLPMRRKGLEHVPYKRIGIFLFVPADAVPGRAAS